MRILFAGPWDLAGKAAAEYFLREGHEVCWLTAEPRRTLWDRKLQGTVCRGQFTAAQIVPILRTHRIETVIVLTAGLREGPDACPDPQAGPLGELLAAVQSCPVGCFVYLSSLELAWQSPLTPRQAALAAGELLLTTVPESLGAQFDTSYRRMGVADFGDYLTYDTITFAGELLPGLTGRTFSGETFSDVALSVTLEEGATVWAWADTARDRRTPLIWSYDCGRGRVTVFNSTSGKGDFWRGILAGCVNTLSDTVLYPVVNALCLFIDDFPSPQYESESDVVRDEYNRSAKEFYRDIWWPEMLRIAKIYGDVYTGLFVATYNDETDPDRLHYTQSATEQYFGNSLLKNGFEMGAHGYNHQPLTAAGGTPAEMQYAPWSGRRP